MITDFASPLIVSLPSMRSAAHIKASRNVPMHSHHEMELVLVLQGTVGTQVEQAGFEGKPGTLFILPAQTPHNQTCRGQWHTLCVLFSNNGGILDDTPRVLQCPPESRIRSWMLELAKLHDSSVPVPSIVSDSLLLALLSQIAHLESSLKTIKALPPRLAVAVRYLQQHVNEEVDAAVLAQAAGVSSSRLGALFRAYFGCAPLKYHQSLRIGLAKKLLLNPYASIDEIAQQVGFTDANYFCRLFRKLHAISPGKWRKATRPSPED